MESDSVLILILVIYISCLLFKCVVSQIRQDIRREEGNDERQNIVQILNNRGRELRRIVRENINVVILTNDNNYMNITEQDDSDIENQLDKCSICHNILDEHVIKTECNHRYHKGCLLSWISSGQRRSLKCPVCVQSLSL